MYIPPKSLLVNYAHILVDFALGGGTGIKPNEVVYLQYDAPAEPLALAVYQRILEKGGHPIVKSNEVDFSKDFYQVANNAQLEFFPRKYMKSMVETIDHRVYLMADRDPLFLRKIDPAKIMKANKSKKLIKKWLFEKEDKGKLTWTIALYGTEGMAREAGLNLKEYWEQIIKGCYLDAADPIAKWQKISAELEETRAKLSALPINMLHLTALDTDLWIQMGEKRKWMAGGGCNIPSFEHFTSPDWRGTNGHIYFDQPLYRYGNSIKDIRLEFKNGRVIKAQAAQNEKLLREMIKQSNADKIGEYSLTDKRFSKITKFMAETLYDENFGGEWGNTHLAVGSSYHDCYTGEASKLKEADWKRLGFNDSAEHCDIISTGERVVEATLTNGVKKIIYKNGQFILS